MANIISGKEKKTARKKDVHKRIFVLDTNVLMHDPTALFRFAEHDVFLPMAVLEELDSGKKGISEVARNARQTSRYLDELISGITHEQIVAGIPLPEIKNDFGRSISPTGRLLFQTSELLEKLPVPMPGNKPDNTILSTALALQHLHPGTLVTVVSKDINLRIKSGILGINTEDYFNDRVLEDVSLLHRGLSELPAEFWKIHKRDLNTWQENARTFCKISGPAVVNWQPNECVYSQGEHAFDAIVREVKGDTATVEYAKDYTHVKHAVWGITARNREQNFALNLLMDPNIDFISLQGAAGGGKTLLTLAAGLAQTLEQNLYREIIMTRVTVSVGEDIGFLPGTEEEKMTPWMGALMDNLEVLNTSSEGGAWGRAVTNDLLLNRVKVRSLNFMRGRTFLNKFIILDEAQNLTSKQIKTLVTRAGPGTKIVCLGDLQQIDTPYLTANTSGLTYAIHHFKSWPHSAHMTLVRGERSRLAEYAAKML